MLQLLPLPTKPYCTAIVAATEPYITPAMPFIHAAAQIIDLPYVIKESVNLFCHLFGNSGRVTFWAATGH